MRRIFNLSRFDIILVEIFIKLVFLVFGFISDLTMELTIYLSEVEAEEFWNQPADNTNVGIYDNPNNIRNIRIDSLHRKLQKKFDYFLKQDQHHISRLDLLEKLFGNQDTEVSGIKKYFSD